MDELKNDDPISILRALQDEQRRQTEKLEGTCWFCGVEPPTADKKHWAGVHLEKVISSSVHKQVSRTLNVPVPRCEKCYQIHMRMTWVIRAGLIAFFGPVVLAVTGIFGSGFANVMPYIMSFGLAVLVLGTLLYHITFPKNTHMRSYERRYPAVLEAKSQGYQGFWGRLFHA